MSAVLVVIPARYSSNRFPGKPLADLLGRPMIERVWERACRLKRADRVIIATDDERIAVPARRFGAEVCLTASSHKNGTERVAEVAASLSYPVVVNLQGDLPLFNPETLDRVIEAGSEIVLKRQSDMVTVQSPIASYEEWLSPHVVKVVSNPHGQAIYFSRAPIPYLQSGTFDASSFVFQRHYGIYLFCKAFLQQVAKSDEGALERLEQLEQLRALERGGRIQVIDISREEAADFFEVNRPEDLVVARELLQGILSRGESG